MSATDGAFESGLMAGGVTFSQVFETPGAFDYVCAIHPEMRGTVTVAAPPDPAAQPTQPWAATSRSRSSTWSMRRRRVEVTAGTTVHWTNDDSVIHTVTARDGSFNSGVMQTGAEFSLTFDEAGHVRLLLRRPPAAERPGRRDRSGRLSQGPATQVHG